MVSSESGSQEVELNLAPIIDCFTVLITYLLVTASFLTLTALEVSVSANSDSADPQNLPPLPPLTMTIDVHGTYELTLKVNGGDLPEPYEAKIPALSGHWNSPMLEQTLDSIKTRWPNLKEASITAAGTITYREIVNLINDVQKTLSKVYLAGG